MLLDFDLGALADWHRAGGHAASLLLREDPRAARFGTIGVDREGRVRRVAEPLRPGRGMSSRRVRLGQRALAADLRLPAGARRLQPPRRLVGAGAGAGRGRHPRARRRPESVSLGAGRHARRVPGREPRARARSPISTSTQASARAGARVLRDATGAPSVVLGAGARLAEGVALTRAVVWDGERVPAGFRGERRRLRRREPGTRASPPRRRPPRAPGAPRRERGRVRRHERRLRRRAAAASPRTSCAQPGAASCSTAAPPRRRASRALGIDRDEIDAIVVSHFHGDHFGGIPALLLAAVYGDGRSARSTSRARPASRSACATPPGPSATRSKGATLGFELALPRAARGHAAAPRRLRARGVPDVPRPRVVPPRPALPRGRALRRLLRRHRLVRRAPRRTSRGADLFICECTQERRGYPYHLSLEELEPRRRELDCGRMVLTHLGPEMRARSDYRGFEVADDGLDRQALTGAAEGDLAEHPRARRPRCSAAGGSAGRAARCARAARTPSPPRRPPARRPRPWARRRRRGSAAASAARSAGLRAPPPPTSSARRAPAARRQVLAPGARDRLGGEGDEGREQVVERAPRLARGGHQRLGLGAAVALASRALRRRAGAGSRRRGAARAAPRRPGRGARARRRDPCARARPSPRSTTPSSSALAGPTSKATTSSGRPPAGSQVTFAMPPRFSTRRALGGIGRAARSGRTARAARPRRPPRRRAGGSPRPW